MRLPIHATTALPSLPAVSHSLNALLVHYVTKSNFSARVRLGRSLAEPASLPMPFGSLAGILCKAVTLCKGGFIKISTNYMSPVAETEAPGKFTVILTFILFDYHVPLAVPYVFLIFNFGSPFRSGLYQVKSRYIFCSP